MKRKTQQSEIKLFQPIDSKQQNLGESVQTSEQKLLIFNNNQTVSLLKSKPQLKSIKKIAVKQDNVTLGDAIPLQKTTNWKPTPIKLKQPVKKVPGPVK